MREAIFQAYIKDLVEPGMRSDGNEVEDVSAYVGRLNAVLENYTANGR